MWSVEYLLNMASSTPPRSSKPRPIRDRLGKGRLRRAIARPLVAAEWFFEWADYYLDRWAFIKVLGHIAQFTLLVGIVSWLMEADDRRARELNARKQVRYAAWELINGAVGRPSVGGRVDALQDLNELRASLEGLDISGALLDSLSLPGARLQSAQMRGVVAENSDFRRANLLSADLYRAALAESRFDAANLTLANLVGACLREARFDSASLMHADLRGASLIGATFRGAMLDFADLRYAQLPDSANLFAARLVGANIFGAEARPELLQWAVDSLHAMSIESTAEWTVQAGRLYRGGVVDRDSVKVVVERSSRRRPCGRGPSRVRRLD